MSCLSKKTPEADAPSSGAGPIGLWWDALRKRVWSSNFEGKTNLELVLAQGDELKPSAHSSIGAHCALAAVIHVFNVKLAVAPRDDDDDDDDDNGTKRRPVLALRVRDSYEYKLVNSKRPVTIDVSDDAPGLVSDHYRQLALAARDLGEKATAWLRRDDDLARARRASGKTEADAADSSDVECEDEDKDNDEATVVDGVSRVLSGDADGFAAVLDFVRGEPRANSFFARRADRVCALAARQAAEMMAHHFSELAARLPACTVQDEFDFKETEPRASRPPSLCFELSDTLEERRCKRDLQDVYQRVIEAHCPPIQSVGENFKLLRGTARHAATYWVGRKKATAAHTCSSGGGPSTGLPATPPPSSSSSSSGRQTRRLVDPDTYVADLAASLKAVPVVSPGSSTATSTSSSESDFLEFRGGRVVASR